MLPYLLTLLIMMSYFLLISSISEENLLNKFIMTSVMSCAQIILSELILGLTKNLYIKYLIIVNILIVAFIVVYAFMRGPKLVLSRIKNEVNGLYYDFKSLSDTHNIILGLIVLIAYSWILVCAYYLPIRGVDDLYYHLPPILEYIQLHEIKLLPTAVHTSFAFPENAELLYMWPTILSHNQTMLDGLNVPFVFFSIIILYALIRYFGASFQNALFASFLYALCPVILMQSGTNYIDIIVSLFLLVGLYLSLMFYKTERTIYLYTAAVSIGLVRIPVKAASRTDVMAATVPL